MTVILAVSPVNGLMFHSAYISLKRLRGLDEAKSIPPNGEVISIYDGARAHRDPAIRVANTEQEMLPA